jgi:hypothetical protein
MKMVKSLILGSAAGLVAMSGAQAADLPVKAKAVEYVRICSLYGAGFYYIPGTDTCIKLGGYLRADYALNTNSIYTAGRYSGAGGANNQLSNYYTTRGRLGLNIDTRTATEYGVVRAYFDSTMSWTSGSYTQNGLGTTYTGDGIALGSLGVYHAFIQFAGFTMGRTISQFDAPWSAYPGNNFDGLVGGGGTVVGVNQFAYTAQLGNGVSITLSAEDQAAYYQGNIWNTAAPAAAATVGATPANIVTGVYGANSIGGARAPDIIGKIGVDQAWGVFQVMVAAHNNQPGYYGATENTGHPDDKWGFAVQGALQIKNLPTGAGDDIKLQAVYTDGASRYNFHNLTTTSFAMYGGASLPGAYQSLGIAGVADAVYGPGGQLETVKTWGLRGAFNHNWDPYWSSSLYGAYAQVRYGGAGSALVCANITPLLVAGSTCNPDFNIAQLGLVTRWTPVKGLTFSADVTYHRLDQKYAGAINSPTVAAVAKPAAVYELKDQDTVSMLLRAQRNF